MQTQVSFSSRLFSILFLFEKMIVAVALIGVAFKTLHLTGGNVMLMTSMPILAMIYFLLAFRPPQKTVGETGFTKLLASTILPKVAWIAAAVLAMGIASLFLQLSGSRQMLMIGSVGGVAAIVILGLLMAQGNESAKSQTGVLYRLAAMLTIIFLVAFEVIKW